MEQYDNLNNKKISKMDKKCETCALLCETFSTPAK